MKRFFAILLLLSILITTGCAPDRCAQDILLRFCEEYPISANVYSSLSDEGEAGYIDKDMLNTLYGTDKLGIGEFALALYGKVDTVREVGVFVIEMGDDELELTELISRRIDFLSSFTDGEGFIRKYRGVIVYGFVDNASSATALFDRII